MNRPTKYFPEVRDRAVRMVFEHEGPHESNWVAIVSMAGKISCSGNDHGPGISGSNLPRRFGPFVPVDEARDRPGGSYDGSGLAIAERSLGTDGGHLAAKSRPVRGHSMQV